jgi:hypothetical protein
MTAPDQRCTHLKKLVLKIQQCGASCGRSVLLGILGATPIQNNSGLPQGPGRTTHARLGFTDRLHGWEDYVRHKAARLHHAARRRGGRVAACNARAAAHSMQ